jgi:transposase
MDRVQYLVDAVVIEGRGIREVARSNGVSKSWVAELVRRYRAGGEPALRPRSKRPHRSPQQLDHSLEDEICRLRKRLCDLGADAGPRTIAWHLERLGRRVPAESTIARVLMRRGFVSPQPKKRPKSSYLRFEAALPNECWQSDITHWRLSSGQEVSILNYLDDHSRLCVASVARSHTTATDVVATFHRAASTWGYPASVLTSRAPWIVGHRIEEGQDGTHDGGQRRQQ